MKSFLLLSVVIYSGLLFVTLSLARVDAGNGTRTKDYAQSKLENITVEAINDTSFILRWKASMESQSDRCPVARYMIRLKAEGVKGSRTWTIDGSRHSVTLHDLVTGTNYHARILAVDCAGKGKPSRWMRIRSAAGEHNSTSRKAAKEVVDTSTPGKPTYVRTRTFSDSVVVSWLPPEDNETVVRGYMIGYGEGVPDVNWQYLEASRTNLTIRNLKSTTQYIVSLRAFNNAGKGPVVYDLIYTREGSVAASVLPSASPTHLKAKVLSPTSVWLQWTDPSLGRTPNHQQQQQQQQQPTDNRYYNVHYHAVSPTAGKTLSVVVKAFHVVLEELVPGTRYEFKVRTVKDSRASDFSAVVSNRTFEIAPGSSPRDVVVAMATNDSSDVTVTWRPPRLSNGNITGYLVLYSLDPAQADDSWQLESVQGHELATTVSNLLPDRTYQFKVQGRNSKGYSPMSNVTVFQTKPQQHSDRPRNSSSSAPTTQTPRPVARATVNRSGNTAGGDRRPKIGAIRMKEDNDRDSDRGTDTEPAHGVDRPASLSPSTTDGAKRRQATSPPSSRQDRSTPSLQPQILEPPVRPPSSKAFLSVVHHQVSAYVTWPETLARNCGSDVDDARAVTSLASPTGYLFRYRKNDVSDETVGFVVRNLTRNAVLLDGLVPDSKYRYQVKYLFGGTRSSWSGESSFDTHYRRHGS